VTRSCLRVLQPDHRGGQQASGVSQDQVQPLPLQGKQRCFCRVCTSLCCAASSLCCTLRLHWCRHPGPRVQIKPVRMEVERCACQDVCGPHCVNRMLQFECFDTETSSNCNVGAHCTNRTLQVGGHKPMEPFKVLFRVSSPRVVCPCGQRASVPAATVQSLVQRGNVVDVRRDSAWTDGAGAFAAPRTLLRASS
jgi:hypothetical protein